MSAPTREPATPRDLWGAADRLTKPTRTKLIRDDGASESVELPSLLDQLVEAMESGTETGTAHGVPASRPPTDAAALSLLIEIAGTIRDACRQRRIKRSFDDAKDLRALVSAINTEGQPDRIDACARLVGSWCGRIKATISSDPDRTWRMHGAACRVCRSTSVPVFEDDGSEARQPALIVHSQDGRIERISCDFCGSVLSSDAMLDIVRETRKAVDRQAEAS